jgi:hypothetical protein
MPAVAEATTAKSSRRPDELDWSSPFVDARNALVGGDPVQDWEINSELVLVSLEVRTQALAVLAAQRTSHLLRLQAAAVDAREPPPRSRLLVVGLYVLRTVALTAVLALIAAAGTVGFAVALELAHRLSR